MMSFTTPSHEETMFQRAKRRANSLGIVCGIRTTKDPIGVKAIAMRLFKRQSSDNGPQLVSATPLSQDGNTPLAIVDGNSDSSNKMPQQENDGSKGTPIKENVNDPQKPSPAHSCVSNRKGISTWGRKMGRRWDQLKRSDSSELLSVSGRRRRWSPNRQSYTTDEKENGDNGSPELPKPKRISRVESLRNLFRSSERGGSFLNNDLSSRNITIQEEDVTCISHYPMEKALSEGAIKNVPFRVDSDDSRSTRGTYLREKKVQLSRSIQNLQEQHLVLDYILKNQEIFKTQEGSAFVRETLDKVRRSTSPDRRNTRSIAEGKKSNVSTQTRDFFSNQLSNIKKNLFNVRASGNECERADNQRPCTVTGLEELMNNLRLGCDESGYDSDSTRAGADSPDSEKSVPPMLKPRSFSITSDDYHGIDLSLPVCPPSKTDSPTRVDENDAESSCLDDTLVLNKSLLSESIRTDSTAIPSEAEDTDSCDEDTFEGFAEYQQSCAAEQAKSNLSSLLKCDSGLSKGSSVSSGGTFESQRASSILSEHPRTTENRSISKPRDQIIKLSSSQKDGKSQIPLKTKKHGNSSALNLLENAASPCKDSPPALKLCSAVANSPLQYYTPKRTRSNLGAEDVETDSSCRSKLKRPAQVSKIAQSVPATPAKTLIRRELKTMKLSVEKIGSLGISVERREAVRPFYVISRMDAAGEAAKSKLFRIGDEIVRVCGRRIRGMTLIEARNALKNCSGVVELQIAREPTFTFGEELGDTWGDILVRTRSDSEVWTLKEEKTEAPASVDAVATIESPESCKIVGALMKDGKNLSVNSMDRLQGTSDTRKESDQKMTGMKKFQVVRKRTANPVSYPRRATSLSMDLLTITLEKGTSKKLGFSIVGGSDSNKGSMGIFVKDIMAAGQAAEEGTLKVGDEILAINGISMDGLTHAKALQTFKVAKPGKIVLHVGRRDPTHKRYIFQSKSYDCLDKLTETGDE